MKTSGFFILLLMAACLVLPSCKSDFDVNAEWKDITVVYGLLSQNDSIHYLKINKAFLGPGNALEYATIPDSSSYGNNIEVKIDEYDGNTFVRSLICDTTTITDKDSGTFYYPKQVVYTMKADLNQNYLYKLNIHNLKTGKDITSQTQLVHSISPQPGPSASFVSTDEEIKWKSGKNGRRYEVAIRFHYSEAPVTDPAARVFKSVYFILQKGIKSTTLAGAEEMVVTFDGKVFYNFIKNNVPYNPDVVRVPGLIDYIISAGSEELSTYIDVNEPSSSIIQEKPQYTNITNGLGLFSSRFVSTVSLNLSDASKDSLKNGKITGDLF